MKVPSYLAVATLPFVVVTSSSSAATLDTTVDEQPPKQTLLRGKLSRMLDNVNCAEYETDRDGCIGQNGVCMWCDYIGTGSKCTTLDIHFGSVCDIAEMPSSSPTLSPTSSPTMAPTTHPTIHPTMVPTANPTTDGKQTGVNPRSPTASPSAGPTSDGQHPGAYTSPTTSPTVTPTSAPTEQNTLIYKLDRNELTCPSGMIPVTILGDGCNVLDVKYEVYVGVGTHTPKSTLCNDGIYSSGGGSAGCRICGTGIDYDRTLLIVADYRDTATRYSCSPTSRFSKLISDSIYSWKSHDTICNDRDFYDDDGGSFITVDLVNAMPNIMIHALCEVELIGIGW